MGQVTQTDGFVRDAEFLFCLALPFRGGPRGASSPAPAAARDSPITSIYPQPPHLKQDGLFPWQVHGSFMNPFSIIDAPRRYG